MTNMKKFYWMRLKGSSTLNWVWANNLKEAKAKIRSDLGLKRLPKLQIWTDEEPTP